MANDERCDECDIDPGSDSDGDSISDNNSSCGDSDSDSDCDSANHISGTILRAVRRAGKAGSTKAVQTLLAQGASPNTADEDGTTLLMVSVDHGNEALTKVLLAAGADSNARNDQGMTALMVAVDHPSTFKAGKTRNIARRLACIDALLAAGADINARDTGGYTALMWACQHSHEDAVYVRALLSNSADINAVDDEGWTALMMVVHQDVSNVYRARRDATITHLIAAGADVNAITKRKKSALMRATCHCDDRSVYKLLKAGADVNAADENGTTALRFALHLPERQETGGPYWYKRQLPLRRLLSTLLRAGADVNAADQHGHTPLMIAAEIKPAFLSLLLERSTHTPDVNAKAKNGRTALMFLVSSPWHPKLPALLQKQQRDADDASEQISATAAALVAAQEHEAVVLAKYTAANLVLDDAMRVATDAAHEANWTFHEAEVHMYDWTLYKLRPQETPEQEIARQRVVTYHAKLGEHHRTRDQLANAQAQTQKAKECADFAVDTAKQIESHIAALAKESARIRTRAIRALLRKGADFDAQQADGLNALMLAASAQHEYAFHQAQAVGGTIMSALIKGITRVDATSNLGLTPLMYAAHFGHTSDVLTLLAHGANVQAKTDNGVTALHMASYHGHTTTVAALLAAKANVHGVDGDGTTALHAAFFQGHTAVVTMLLVRGPLLLPFA